MGIDRAHDRDTVEASILTLKLTESSSCIDLFLNWYLIFVQLVALALLFRTAVVGSFAIGAQKDVRSFEGLALAPWSAQIVTMPHKFRTQTPAPFLHSLQEFNPEALRVGTQRATSHLAFQHSGMDPRNVVSLRSTRPRMTEWRHQYCFYVG